MLWDLKMIEGKRGFLRESYNVLCKYKWEYLKCVCVDVYV